MSTTPEPIEKAALDARMTLSAEEKERVMKSSRALMEQLGAISKNVLKDIPATFYGHKQAGKMREDEKQPSLPLEKTLQNAADADEYCFHVPRIVEE